MPAFVPKFLFMSLTVIVLFFFFFLAVSLIFMIKSVQSIYSGYFPNSYLGEDLNLIVILMFL